MTMIQARTLKEEGLPTTAIARRLGLHRQTVAKYLQQVEDGDGAVGTPPPRTHLLDPYLP